MKEKTITLEYTEYLCLLEKVKESKEENYVFDITFNKSHNFFRLELNQPSDKLDEDIKNMLSDMSDFRESYNDKSERDKLYIEKRTNSLKTLSLFDRIFNWNKFIKELNTKL